MMTKTASENDSKTSRIMIVDDHPVLTRGVSLVIDEEADLEVCAVAGSAEEALSLFDECQPDMVIIDLSLPGKDGLELIRDLRARRDDLPVLVLSAHEESQYAERAMRAGAMGYLMKREDIDTVARAVHTVLKGEVFLSDEMMPKLLAKLMNRGGADDSPFAKLSDRELLVFERIGQGHQTREIAEQLHLSPKTIQVYRDHIKKKLNLRNSVELHQRAYEWVRTQAK